MTTTLCDGSKVRTAVGTEDLPGCLKLVDDDRVPTASRQKAEAVGTERLKSTQLTGHLVRRGDSSPWAFFWREVDQTAAQDLARRLKPFGIVPHDHRFGDDIRKGYLRVQFEPEWTRYSIAARVPETVEQGELDV
jgi:hypothetical protein